MLIAKVGLTILLSTAGLWLLSEGVSTTEVDAAAAAQSEYLELIRDGNAVAAVRMEF